VKAQVEQWRCCLFAVHPNSAGMYSVRQGCQRRLGCIPCGSDLLVSHSLIVGARWRAEKGGTRVLYTRERGEGVSR
jgi:hypothetical protein